MKFKLIKRWHTCDKAKFINTSMSPTEQLTKPDEVNEILTLFRLKSPSLDLKAKLKLPCFFLQVAPFMFYEVCKSGETCYSGLIWCVLLANTALDKYKNQEFVLYDDYYVCVVKYNVYVWGKDSFKNPQNSYLRPKIICAITCTWYCY